MRGEVIPAVLLASLIFGPTLPAFAQDDELVGKPPVEEAPTKRETTIRLGNQPQPAPAPRPTTPPDRAAEELTPDELEERFRALTQQGSEAFAAERYDEAIGAFEQAYALKPATNILYNLGRIHEAKGDLDPAIASYESFVTSPGVDQKPREDALSRLRALKEVQALKREADPAAQPEGATAAEPSVAASAQTTAPSYTLSYVLLGAGGAALIGAGVFGLLASGAHADAEDAQTLPERRDAADSGETYAIVADSLLVTGLVTGALGGLAWWWSSAEADDGQAVRVGPELGADRVGVRVRWDY